MYLALIKFDEKGNPIVLKNYMETTDEDWMKFCKVAEDAIVFQEKYSEIERFNAVHTHLLLTNLIHQGVIKKTGIDVDPLLREKIQTEVARKAWHFSKKKKLMQQFEYNYLKSKGKFNEKIWDRILSESTIRIVRFFGRFVPQPIKDFWKKIKDTFKNFE